MSNSHRIKALLALAAVAMAALAITASSVDAAIYQDTFDNDGLATNTGTGGGLARYARQGDTWVDNGQLDGNSTGSNDRGNVYSLNSFLLTQGFKLEVSYTINDVSNANANRVNIGLIDALPAVQDNTTYVTLFLGVNLDKYGIGLNMTTDSGSQGLNFADDAGSGTLTALSNAQTISTGTHTFVLEMDTASNWSYSIDGAAATTGTIGGAGFDLTRDYQFFAYVQDYRNNRIKIHSVTLVPEPATLALLAMGGVALVLHRKRR